ncbi:MAG TPA: hypothetical protein VEK80_01230 [Kribbellaceae bacterium]|nr:hypothetical protein [Kribbellaceae bacterium]
MSIVGAADGYVENEFASIAVSLDGEGNSMRLRVEDLRGGRVRFFDPLQLESLVWLADERLESLLDPSADRWRR